MNNIKARQERLNKLSEIVIFALIVFVVSYMTIAGVVAKNNVVETNESEVVEIGY